MKPRRPKTAYAMQTMVEDLATRFVYPDLDTRPGPPFISGGGGAPTVVVAAVDATDFSKSKADYVCTGINDDQTIQAAITAIPEGGRVLLTEGTFTCRYGQIIISVEAIHIQGMGMATVMDFTSGTGVGIDLDAEGCVVSDLWILGNFLPAAGIDMARPNCSVRNVRVSNIGDAPNNGAIAITFTGDKPKIVNCFLDDNDSPGVWVAAGVDDAIIEGNHFFTNGEAIECLADDAVIVGNTIHAEIGIALSGSDGTRIVGNTIFAGAAGVSVTASQEVTISGNWMTADACVTGSAPNINVIGNVFSSQGWGIDSTGFDWSITDNLFIATDGMRFGTGAERTLIADNRIDTGGQILFTAAVEGCKVSGNHIGDPSALTIDGAIVFDGGATDCQITDNQIWHSSPGSLDGIRVESALDVLISGNHLREGAANGIIVNGDRVLIEGNLVKFATEHGIVLTGDSSTINDNQVYASSRGTTNTSDNIIINGDGNLVEGNHSLPAETGATPRYGINIAGGNDNAVYANALGDSSVYGTADSIDSGTNTQTSPAAGAIGGQFAF
jgi:parallel beta-helix repeat protein